MTQYVGQRNNVFCFLQVHLGKEVTEGVGVHLLFGDAALRAEVLQFLGYAACADLRAVAVHADVSALALGSVLHLLGEEEAAVLLSQAATVDLRLLRQSISQAEMFTQLLPIIRSMKSS